MAQQTVVVDPITRIEGHLRIEAETDDSGLITRASSSGTMVRGIEIILRGRDPREAWAFAQRICGVCTLVHGIASVRSVENALAYPIPHNAELIRNLMIAAQFVHDHVMHFYHLHALDWVDVVSALKADPRKTAELAQSLSSYAMSSPGHFADVQKKVKGLVESGQLGIFANGYWGHPAYKLPPEANLMAVAHYLDALAWQREVVKLHTIFGGKNPHPNFVVGGVPCAISVDAQATGATAGATAVNMVGLAEVANVIERMQQFVDQVYLPDTLAIAGFYKDWATRGEGIGNFMTYGEFPSKSINDPSGFLIPRGVIVDRDLSRIEEVDLNAEDQIKEYVAHSWYDYSGGKNEGLHPYSWKLTNLAIHLVNGVLIFLLTRMLLAFTLSRAHSEQESAGLSAGKTRPDKHVVQKSFQTPPQEQRPGTLVAHKEKAGIIAVLITAAWLLLPINLTGVLYVVQRMESLANVFVLLGLVGYVAG
ncbi:MAG: nickel-dependent hydrogenase large subunit, partial [Acidihalobacter sp.]